MSWIIPLLAIFSFSVRSPNELPNPYDYQFAYTAKADTLFYYSEYTIRNIPLELSVNTEYERELGRFYRNDDLQLQYRFHNLSTKTRYYNKTSKDIWYNQIDIRYNLSIFSVGYALRYADERNASRRNITNNLVLGYKFDKQLLKNTTLASFIDITLNPSNKPIISTHTELTKKLTEYINLVCLCKYERINNKIFYQFKIGMTFNLNVEIGVM